MYPNFIPEAEIMPVVYDHNMHTKYEITRLLKAIDILISGYVQPDGYIGNYRTYLIESNQGLSYNRHGAYRVTGNYCKCQDEKQYCKHIIARIIYEQWRSCHPIEGIPSGGAV